MLPIKRDYVLLTLLSSAAAAAWLAFKFYTSLTLEDALITYRYAQNIAEGNGFVFNIGERVQGTSTPLLTLLLGIAGWVFGSDQIPIASNVLMFAASLCSGIFTFLGLCALNLSRGLAAFTVLIFFLSPTTMWTTTGGMETPLVVCFMSIGFWAVCVKRFSVAAVSSGLLILTRIDGVIWSAGIFLLIFFQDKKAILKPTLIATLIIAPWLLFSILYFGSFIPNTIGAKQAIGNTIEFSLSGMITEARWYANNFCTAAPFSKIVGMLLFLVGATSILRSASPAILRWLVVFPFVFVGVLYLGRAPHFPWYAVPVSWCSLVVGMIGLRELWEWVGSKINIRPQKIILTLAAFFVAATLWTSTTAATYYHKYQFNEDGTRKKLGLWLKNNTPTDASVAMEAIGYQGYYSERRVIDLAGLVSPEVVKMRRNNLSNADVFDNICSILKPDYIILRSFEYEENQHYHGGPLFLNDLQKNQFDRNYTTLTEFVAPLPEEWGNLSRLTVFQRKR